MLKKDLEPFRGLPPCTDVKFAINCVELLLGVKREMSALKKNIILRLFGPSSGVMFELRRIISNRNWPNAWLILPYIGLGWLYHHHHHEHILATQVAYFKA